MSDRSKKSLLGGTISPYPRPPDDQDTEVQEDGWPVELEAADEELP